MNDDHYKILTLAMAGVLVISGVAVVAFALDPGQSGATYTELYILGPEGTAGNYPTDLTVEETGRFVVGVGNKEGEQMMYTLLIEIEGEVVTEQSFTVADGDVLEEPVIFTPTSPGRTVVLVQLYRGEARSTGQPYRSVRLNVNVTDRSALARPELVNDYADGQTVHART